MQESTLVNYAEPPKTQDEISSFQEALFTQNELIGVLRDRLNVVSSQQVTKEGSLLGSPMVAETRHISLLVDSVRNNNRKLSQLIDELVV